MPVVVASAVPDEEQARLAAVRRYDVLDTPPDGAFERITAVAARLFDVPISIISIVDADRIWFKSHHGLEADEIGRDPGLCASAILEDSPWLITDARADPRTLANPLVAGEFGLQFYAGAPLRTHDGHNLGTLCVIDREPREVTAEEARTLTDLASVVMDELELRLSARRTLSLEAELRHQAEGVAATLQESLVPPTLPEIDGLEVASRYHVARRDKVGGDFYDVIAGDEATAIIIGDACGKGTTAATAAGTARWTLHTLLTNESDPASSLDRLNTLLSRSLGTAGYVTVAAACLRPAGTGLDLGVAVGGHPHPLVARAGGRIESVGVTGPIVGWFPDSSYKTAMSTLGSGDLLLMFTDGLLEAVGGLGATDDSPIRDILRATAACSAAEVADRLDAVIGSGRSDDAAFVVIRVL